MIHCWILGINTSYICMANCAESIINTLNIVFAVNSAPKYNPQGRDKEGCARFLSGEVCVSTQAVCLQITEYLSMNTRRLFT